MQPADPMSGADADVGGTRAPVTGARV